MKKNIFLKKDTLYILIMIVSCPLPLHANELTNKEDNLSFDETMFMGSNISKSVLERLSKSNSIEPGEYKDTFLIVNGYHVGSGDVTVKAFKDKTDICLTDELVNKLMLRDGYIKDFKKLNDKSSCVTINDLIPDATAKLNNDLSLNFTIQQSALKNKDDIPESALNRGENVLFSNYTVNYFHNKQTGSYSNNSDYGYLNLNSGINFGIWQFRHNSSYSYNDSSKGERNSHWNNISTYFQRPLYGIKSKLVIGKVSTTSQFFSGLNYTGVRLSSDERMYPTSQQGYAPVVSGIAKTNALVEIRQNGHLIYQKNVPPGNFEIRDLNASSFNGDLYVTVIEANGSKSTFSVPFSSVPDSVRAGKYKYTVEFGKTRNLIEDATFVDSTVQYGLNNFLTLSSGLRFSDGYASTSLGSALMTNLGAFGVNANYSNSNVDLNNVGTKQGWMFNLNYAKMLSLTNTNIALAGYRYATEGYRDFTDFINERYYLKNSGMTNWTTSSYLQKYRLTASINQPLGAFGNLNLSASTQTYHNKRPRDTTYQISYSKFLFDYMSMNLSVSRQKTYLNNQWDSKYETYTMLSFDIPLGTMNSNISTSIYFDKNNGNQYQTSLSGYLGEYGSPYSYSVNASYDDKSHQTNFGANLSKQYSLGMVTINGSKGKHYSQIGGGLTGAFVVHSGGVTLGPYVGETFAIVEAKGAKGAKVYNGQGAQVNSSGYALVPSLTAYRYNAISLSSDGLENNNVDIKGSEERIAPYSGVAVKVNFKTDIGYPLLITIKTKDDVVIPIGAIVSDNTGKQLGLIGQGNQAYLRTNHETGHFDVQWGDAASQKCSVDYKVPSDMLNKAIIKLSVKCL